jgi:rod shape-determining protein MreB
MSMMKWLKRLERGGDIYVDLGTANTLVVASGRGVVVNEPSVVAYRELGGGGKRIVAVGLDAKEKIGRTPGNLVACHPLKDGVIADLDITEAMLKYFIARGRNRFSMTKPRLVISLPYGVSDVEKKAVRQAGFAAGAREVVMIDEPIAAAVGAGLPVSEPKGSMVIDIGGGTTEVAVVSLYGIVHCEPVRVGGHAFDRAIADYIRRRYNLIIGLPTAEKLKIALGSAMPGDMDTKDQVRGVDFITGLPRSIDISASEVTEAIDPLLTMIFGAARRTLEKMPPDLVEDIMRDGVVLVGGGALIRNIADRLSQEINLPVRVAEAPLEAVAHGGEKVIESDELLQWISVN